MSRKCLYSLSGLLILFLCTFGCDRKTEAPALLLPTPVQAENISTLSLLREPVALHRSELLSGALPVWRQYAAQKPTLLLLSNSPFTLPVPESLRHETDTLAIVGSAEEIASRSHPGCSDLLFVPDMTLDIPLRLGWFKHFVWAVPTIDPETPPQLETLRDQMLAAGLITNEESVSIIGKTMPRALPVSMQLRGTPTTLALLDQLPVIDGPVVLHIDLSYFQGLYKSEVATPVLGLVAQTLTTLRDKNIQVLAVTFSYGNLDSRIALDVRFQGDLLAELLADPKVLSAPLASPWKEQKDILYLKDFFKKEMILERAKAQESAFPAAPFVKFNLFRAEAEMNHGSLALDYFAAAVKLDKVYAVGYLDLADLAFNRNRPDEALRMLRLANVVWPEDIHIRLQMAQLANHLGDRKTALHLVEQLQALTWSPIYYPEMPGYLQGFAKFLQEEPVPGITSPPMQPRPAMKSKSGNGPNSVQGTGLPTGHP